MKDAAYQRLMQIGARALIVQERHNSKFPALQQTFEWVSAAFQGLKAAFLVRNDARAFDRAMKH